MSVEREPASPAKEQSYSFRTDVIAVLAALAVGAGLNLVPVDWNARLGLLALGWPFESVDFYPLVLADMGRTSPDGYLRLYQELWDRGEIGPNGASALEGRAWLKIAGRPLLVDATAIMINVAIPPCIATVMFWTCRARRSAIRRRRIAENLCLTCGYPRAGIDDRPCPECGSAALGPRLDRRPTR